MSTGYWVSGQVFAAALTDGSTLVLCKGAVGRAGRSVVTHHDTTDAAIESYQALEKQFKDEGYDEEILPQHIGKSLKRHLSKEPLAGLELPLKFKSKVEAFV